MKPLADAFPIALALFVGSASSHAQDGTNRPTSQPSRAARTEKADAHGVRMDELSRATLDRWEAMEYHLGRAGAKTVSFTVKIVSKSPLGNTEATGKYRFDGKKGTLKWDNAGLGSMLAKRGWSRDSFDRLFLAGSHRRSLAGASLTATKDGSDTVLTVDGETDGGYRTFRYGEDGVAKQFTIAVEDPVIGKRDAVIRVQLEKTGGKYVRVGWTYDMKLEKGGFTGQVTIENKRVGKFHVYDTVEEKLILNGRTVGSHELAFTDYKINGVPEAKPSASKPDEKVETETKAKPTSKPTGKR